MLNKWIEDEGVVAEDTQNDVMRKARSIMGIVMSIEQTQIEAESSKEGGAMGKARILAVEDEAVVAEDIRAGLIDLGYTVTGIAGSGEEALLQSEESKPELV